MLLLEYKGEAEGFVHSSRGRVKLDEEEEDTGVPDEETDSGGAVLGGPARAVCII